MERLADDPDPRARHGSALHLARPFERRRDPPRHLARRARACSACRSRSPSCSAPMSDRASFRSASPCARRRRRSACFSATSPSALIGAVIALVAHRLRRGSPAARSAPTRRGQIANAHTGFNVAARPRSSCRSSARSRASSSGVVRDAREHGREARQPSRRFGARSPGRRARQRDPRGDAPRRHRRTDAAGDDPDLPRRATRAAASRSAASTTRSTACRRRSSSISTRLTRQPLDEEDTRRCFDLILFTTNLEHVGDIIDRGLLALAAKRQRNGVAFSEAGWAEIAALHQRVVEQMRLAVTVFVTRDLALATRARRREGPHPRSGDEPRPRAISSACARARSQASRRARCISTSCAT